VGLPRDDGDVEGGSDNRGAEPSDKVDECLGADVLGKQRVVRNVEAEVGREELGVTWGIGEDVGSYLLQQRVERPCGAELSEVGDRKVDKNVLRRRRGLKDVVADKVEVRTENVNHSVALVVGTENMRQREEKEEKEKMAR
jgi:hypothetical protein